METLSDKIIDHEEQDNPIGDAICTEDVKQFINDLKEELIDDDEINRAGFIAEKIENIIDKLAGDKLI